MQVTTTLSSVGNTRAINCDWLNNEVIGVSVTGSSSGSFAYSVQYTLDDLQLTAPSQVQWISDPNATALTSNSSGVFTYTAPLAGIRLSASAISSAILTFKVNQGLI